MEELAKAAAEAAATQCDHHHQDAFTTLQQQQPRQHTIISTGKMTNTQASSTQLIPATACRRARRRRARHRNQLSKTKLSNLKLLNQRQTQRTLLKLAVCALLLLATTHNDKLQEEQHSSVDQQRHHSSSSWAYMLSGAYAFNVDSQSAIVHQGPAGSYFGFTVAQHRDRNQQWLLVGAPQAQTDQPKVTQGGAVYRCSPTFAPRTCQQIAFDPNGHGQIKLLDQKVQIDDKSHQWFGASLHSATDNGSIVACAPKYVYYSTSFKRRDPVGTCYVSRGSFDGFLEYSPCRVADQWGHHKLGSCQAGFASALAKDGSRLYVGAPGSHVWQGQVFAHNLRTDLKNATSGVNPRTEDDSYIGYSLAMGKFSARGPGAHGNDPNDVAIGVPRGADLVGKVMIVDSEMRTMRNITGEQMGAYFGYALAVADVNGDGLDDLLIGAPLYYNKDISHKEPHFERGRVYVAMQDARHDFRIAQRLDGRMNQARFGTAIANCGDLNRDGVQDVAVGAPYDGPNGHGAVYIFMGRKNAGLAQEPDQVIYAEEVRGEGQMLRAFGFALSGGADVDNNTYPDLLVGDYKSDRAVLLRARPVVNVDTSISFSPENLNLDDKNCITPQNSSCLTVRYCTKYTGHSVDSRLPFEYQIKLDTENKGAPRLFFVNNASASEDQVVTTLSKDSELCQKFTAFVRNGVRDKLTPIKIDIDYKLAETGAPQMDYALGVPKLKPVLNKPQGDKQQGKLHRVAQLIQKNCGTDNVCVPDLKLTMEPNTDRYTIGSNKQLVLDVTVRNNGEDAYESMFYLFMPPTINYRGINETRQNSAAPACAYRPDQVGDNVLVCDLGNPQAGGETIKFSVITEPARGDFSTPDFTFKGIVNSTNVEKDDKHREDNEFVVGIRINVEPNLVLSGNSRPQPVEHNITHSIERMERLRDKRPVTEVDIGPQVTHTYTLQNKGPSTINDIAITILWPTKTLEGNYLLYLIDDPETSAQVRCKPLGDDVINPLGLKYVRGPSPPMNSSSTTRYRRQATTEAQTTSLAQPATSTVDQNIVQQMLLQHCGATQCTRFECNVFNLGNNDVATIRIMSRLYEDTINKLSMAEFEISSRLVAQVKSLPYNVSVQYMQPSILKVETIVKRKGSGVLDTVPGWLVLLAILLGILLLMLLVWFLHYLGFFARRRPPPRGTAEREPLAPTIWNEYQYSPGDTAL